MSLLNQFGHFSDSWHVAVISGIKHTMHNMGVHDIVVHDGACMTWACMMWPCMAMPGMDFYKT